MGEETKSQYFIDFVQIFKDLAKDPKAYDAFASDLSDNISRGTPGGSTVVCPFCNEPLHLWMDAAPGKVDEKNMANIESAILVLYGDLQATIAGLARWPKHRAFLMCRAHHYLTRLYKQIGMLIQKRERSQYGLERKIAGLEGTLKALTDPAKQAESGAE